MASGWVRHAAAIDAHSAPFGRAARLALGPLDGLRVLDIGCGTGATTRELVAYGAREAVGVDLSEAMIAAARARFANIADVSFVAADATSDAVTGPFDALFSRFGVMFFDDPLASFTKLHRLVERGGRIAFSSWSGPFDNPWMTAAVLASIPVLGPPTLPGPGEPGPFSLAEPADVADLLEQAGWSNCRVEILTTEEPHPAGHRSAVAQMLIDNVPPLAIGVAEAPETAGLLHEAVVEALVPFDRDGQVVMPASALIVSATA
ncbi:MAG: hypothetical protein JWO77_990 [Ilumatobacteraceae bacterium]|nr:hypothetical protein [Ilumatobacteraceae bacterium]